MVDRRQQPVGRRIVQSQSRGTGPRRCASSPGGPRSPTAPSAPRSPRRWGRDVEVPHQPGLEAPPLQQGLRRPALRTRGIEEQLGLMVHRRHPRRPRPQHTAMPGTTPAGRHLLGRAAVAERRSRRWPGVATMAGRACRPATARLLGETHCPRAHDRLSRTRGASLAVFSVQEPLLGLREDACVKDSVILTEPEMPTYAPVPFTKNALAPVAACRHRAVCHVRVSAL